MYWSKPQSGALIVIVSSPVVLRESNLIIFGFRNLDQGHEWDASLVNRFKFAKSSTFCKICSRSSKWAKKYWADWNHMNLQYQKYNVLLCEKSLYFKLLKIVFFFSKIDYAQYWSVHLSTKFTCLYSKEHRLSLAHWVSFNKNISFLIIQFANA